MRIFASLQELLDSPGAEYEDGDTYWAGASWRTFLGGTFHAHVMEMPSILVASLDLTPLSRFIERRETLGWRWVSASELQQIYPRRVEPVKMYGPIWPVDETPPKPEPKSAADKALEDVAEFERKRIAKRQAGPDAFDRAHRNFIDGIDKDVTEAQEEKRGQIMRDALSKAFVHHTPFTERLAGYRGIPLPALSKAETGAGGVR